MNQPIKKPDGHPEYPVWKLERYLLGELPDKEMRRIDAVRGTDALLAEWIGALQAEHRDLAQMHPTGRVAGRIWSRYREAAAAPRPMWRTPAFLVPAFGVLLLALVLPLRKGGLPGPEKPLPPYGAEAGPERLKGLPPALYLYRKSGADALKLKTGDTVRPGALVQMYYDAAGRAYGAIFSLDKEGNVTWHLPDAGERAVPLQGGGKVPGGKVPLGFAFELDSLAGYERFFFVAADTPFELGPALRGIDPAQLASPRGPERLRLDPSISQHSIVLIKDTGI